jgi:SHNi-TPR
MLLGDLSSENDAFAEALEDYRLALELLSSHLPEARQLRSFRVHSTRVTCASLTSLRPCSPHMQKHVRCRNSVAHMHAMPDY